jgi:hypothetical protein
MTPLPDSLHNLAELRGYRSVSQCIVSVCFDNTRELPKFLEGQIRVACAMLENIVPRDRQKRATIISNTEQPDTRPPSKRRQQQQEKRRLQDIATLHEIGAPVKKYFCRYAGRHSPSDARASQSALLGIVHRRISGAIECHRGI